MTRKQKNEADKLSRRPDSSPALIILYMMGLFGMLSVLYDNALADSKPIVLMITVAIEVFTILLWYIYIHKNKYFMYLVLGICVLITLMIIPSWGNIISGFSQPGGMSGLSALLPFILAIVTLLFFYLEFVLRRHSILFLLCMGMVILAPVLGLYLSIHSVVLIVIFQFGFYVFNTKISFNRSRLIVKGSARASAMSAVAAAVMLLAAFVPAFIAEHFFEDELYMQVYQADGYLQDGINELFGNLSTNLSDGTVSRGNLRQSGNPIFDLSVKELPENRLYLKNYVGSTYSSDRWENAYQQDRTFFEYIDPDSSGDKFGRMGLIFYREPFVTDLLNAIVNDYYKSLLKELSLQTDIKLVSFDYDYKNGYLCCFDQNGREVAVSCELPNDIAADKYLSVPTACAYIFYENSTNRYYGDNLIEQINLYNSDSHASFIINDRMIDISALPVYPSVLNQTSRSEAISDIYTTFGRQGIIYNKELRDFDYSIMAMNPGFDDSQTNRITITPKNNDLMNVCYPYYPAAGNAFGAVGDNDGRITQATACEYYFEDKISMEGRWSDLPDYERFVDSYYDYAKSNYTYIKTNHPKLSALCHETSLDTSNINEVTTFILYTLQTHARYSKTPGSVPFTADTIDYFLFDNHQGYCVHFATAAALMYRMYGIPCRYVTGFAVSNGLFEEDKNSELGFTAEVSDKCAHAWVEIFLKDYGWVPVEVTPTIDGRMTASFPGFNDSVMRNIMKKHGWEFVTRNEDGRIISNDNNGAGGLDSDTFLPMLLFCTAASVVLALTAVFGRWCYSKKKQKTMSCRAAFDKLINMLHFCSLLKDMNGSERNFAADLCEALPELDPRDAARMMSILEAESFSQNGADEQEHEFVRSLYSSCSQYLYARLKWYKKPLFRFIYCFI